MAAGTIMSRARACSDSPPLASQTWMSPSASKRSNHGSVRMLSQSRHGAAVERRRPPRGRDRAGTGKSCRPGGWPGCGRARPGLPGTPYQPLAAAVTVRSPERPTEARTDGSTQRTRRFERRRHSAARPRSTLPLSHASLQVTRVPGESAPSTYPPCDCRLPVRITKRGGIGMGGSGRSACPIVKV